MMLDTKKLVIADEYEVSPIRRDVNVHQDGTTPLYRDVDGKLWAISGHSHSGEIAMFCGTSLDDLTYQYPILTNFCVGHADFAFNNIRYPEGVKSRSSVWPFGLYICPNTHRFFCFFHNESGWFARGTAYDALGPCDQPHYDSDFRHIGLMHSDDEGHTWNFDRWVLSGEQVCFTEFYNPGAGLMQGQKQGIVSLGTGDFSCFVDPDDDFIYLYYVIIKVDTDKSAWHSCDTYVARTRKRTDGMMGDFVKFYNGSFCEAGIGGKETPIALGAWHSRVVKLEKYGCYLMSSCPHIRSYMEKEPDGMHLRTSTDLMNWSEPFYAQWPAKIPANHYMALVGEGALPQVIEGDTLSVLSNSNGTDVLRYRAQITDK